MNVEETKLRKNKADLENHKSMKKIDLMLNQLSSYNCESRVVQLEANSVSLR